MKLLRDLLGTDVGLMSLVIATGIAVFVFSKVHDDEPV